MNINHTYTASNVYGKIFVFRNNRSLKSWKINKLRPSIFQENPDFLYFYSANGLDTDFQHNKD